MVPTIKEKINRPSLILGGDHIPLLIIKEDCRSMSLKVQTSVSKASKAKEVSVVPQNMKLFLVTTNIIILSLIINHFMIKLS